jgi:hypothetical protein
MPSIVELEALLTTPTEVLNVEYKRWLDLRGDDEHKALLAKAAIAIANEGGGHIVIGMREQRPNLVSDPRPAEIAPYDQDAINQIIRRFAAPAFQCTLTALLHPETGHEHAVISIPGGFGFPVMSKSGTPAGTIRPHLCYMRKPGPESAHPENPGDWERLLARCLRNRREDMLDAIRSIVEGKAEGAEPPGQREADQQTAYANAARTQWLARLEPLPPESPARCPLGRFEFDYALLGDLERPNLGALLEQLRCAEQAGGWPEFMVMQDRDLAPIPIDDQVECWVGAPIRDRRFIDSAHADFWRASPEGRLFMLRGYMEDSDALPQFREQGNPGTLFDITSPIFRVAECLLHARALASQLAPQRQLRVLFRARWYGIAGRHLVALDRRRVFFGNYTSQQEGFATETTVSLDRIPDNLPEIIHPLLVPLYERFRFFRLEPQFVASIVAEMRGHRP